LAENRYVSGNSNAIHYPRIIAAIDVRPNLIVAKHYSKNIVLKFTGRRQVSNGVHEKQVEEMAMILLNRKANEAYE
jgi:galactokinase/mevalonate kinase-like predicted kinase